MDRELGDQAEAPLESEALIRCPHCDKRVAADAESCFRCHHTLLFDVVIEPPLERAAERYSIAKAVAAVSTDADVEHVQAQLAKTGAPILERLTRAKSEPVVDVLEAYGLEVHLFPSAPLPVAEPPPAPAIATPMLATPRASGGRSFGCLSFLIALAAIGRLISQSTSAAPSSRPAPAVEQKRLPAPTASLREVAVKASGSTATVRCAGSAGTGFFVAPDQLVTLDRLVCSDGLDPAVELRDGRKLVGTVLVRDPLLDVAVLHVLGAAAKPLPLGDASRLAAGTRLALIGAQEATVRRVGHSPGVNAIELQGDLGLASGGAPLLDAQGRVVGVLSDEPGRAVPIDRLFAGARPLLSRGDARPISVASDRIHDPSFAPRGAR